MEEVLPTERRNAHLHLVMLVVMNQIDDSYVMCYANPSLHRTIFTSADFSFNEVTLLMSTSVFRVQIFQFLYQSCW